MCPHNAQDCALEALTMVEVAEGGEYPRSQLSRAMSSDRVLRDLVDTWEHHCSGVRTICFAVDVAHSKRVVAAFQVSVSVSVPKHGR